MLATIRAEIRESGEYRFGRWGSFWHRFALCRWRWSAALCKFDGHWAMHLFCLWVTLWRSRTPPRDEMLDKWGFSFHPDEACLHLNWGHRTKILYMPWMYDHCRTEVMLADGRFVPFEEFSRGLERNPEPAGRYRQMFPYCYRLRSGEVQVRTATVTVERRAWCWRAWPFRLLRWPSQVRTSIEVEFSGEVGERAGSWKGGTIGCGYELRPGESPEACLRRMEAERKF